MKKFASTLFFGKDARVNGLMAFALIGAIALGCTCNKDLANLGKNDNTAESNSSTTSANTSTVKQKEPKPDASKGALPTDGQLQDLAKETMLDFNDAIAKADFTKFHSKACKPWQKQTSAEAMKGLFQKFIDGRASFGEIEEMTATIKTKKTRKEGGYHLLELAGEYPTSPNATTFDLNYINESGDWKLSKIEVYTTVYNR